MIVFKVPSKLKKTIRLDAERWNHVLKHPEMKNQINRIKETLTSPDSVRESIHETSTWLFYKLYTGTPVTKKYLLVITKILNEEGFIVTAFFTDKVKKGGLVWKKKA